MTIRHEHKKTSYIVAHWRGEQGLFRSFFINGTVAYLILVLVLVFLGNHIATPVWVGLAVFLIWEIWAAVGIFRCGLRYARDQRRSVLVRFAGSGAILGDLAMVYFTIADVWRLGLLP
jgi:hypothetical protein